MTKRTLRSSLAAVAAVALLLSVTGPASAQLVPENPVVGDYTVPPGYEDYPGVDWECIDREISQPNYAPADVVTRCLDPAHWESPVAATPPPIADLKQNLSCVQSVQRPSLDPRLFSLFVLWGTIMVCNGPATGAIFTGNLNSDAAAGVGPSGIREAKSGPATLPMGSVQFWSQDFFCIPFDNHTFVSNIIAGAAVDDSGAATIGSGVAFGSAPCL